MSDMYKPINDNGHGPGPEPHTHHDEYDQPSASRDASRALMAGVLGGLASAAGYLIYSRLPDEQRDRLHQQVRGLLEQRVNELRSRFNL